MPKGVALSFQFRFLIYRRFIAGFTPLEIFELIFGSETNFISFRHLQLLSRKILSDPLFTKSYICGPLKKTGRKSLMSVGEKNVLVEWIALDSTKILNIMHRDFIAMYHGNIEDHPYHLIEDHPNEDIVIIYFTRRINPIGWL